MADSANVAPIGSSKDGNLVKEVKQDSPSTRTKSKTGQEDQQEEQDAFINDVNHHPQLESEQDIDGKETRTKPSAGTDSSPSSMHSSIADLHPVSDNTNNGKLSIEDLIRKAVKNKDQALLCDLATRPGGFQSSELRRITWPVLLSMNEILDAENEESSMSMETLDQSLTLEQHPDENQVKLDTDRAFTAFPQDLDDEEKDKLKEDLRQIIVAVLRKYPSLNYFQGYHDIASVFLLVFDDKNKAADAISKLSLHHIRDSMQKNIDPVMGYLRLFKRLIIKLDPDLTSVIDQAETLPYFALPWVISLMSHDLTRFDVICRIFDVLVTKNPMFIAYIGAAVLTLNKDVILSMDPEFLSDPAIVHALLAKLPEITLDHHDSIEYREKVRRSHEYKSLDTDVTLAGQDDEDEEDKDVKDKDKEDDGNDQPDLLETNSIASTDSGPQMSTMMPGNTRPIYVEDLIQKALELFDDYPLHDESGINASEIMGDRSAIFSWERGITDDEALQFAHEGVNIVLPVPEPVAATNDKEKIEKDEQEKDQNNQYELSKNTTRRPDRKISVVLTVVGVAGILLAIYGGSSDARKNSLKNFFTSWF